MLELLYANSARALMLGFMVASPQAQSDAGFVAGLAPYERPANAPVISQALRSPEWSQRLVRGIEQPLPQGLHFLKDQGQWYTPFNRPGMPGYYDLRGWHKDSPMAQSKSAKAP